jgi:ATP-dependent protease ClpP protease subunit
MENPLSEQTASTETIDSIPQVEEVEGKFIFVWTGTMTGSQSKVAVLEEFARLHPGAKVTVIFNSQGGGVDDCRESYNRMLILRQIFNMHFTFIVMTAKSCALWFIQCADVRIGLPHAALMYHGIRWLLPHSAHCERELELAMDSMARNQQEFTNILCSRSQNSEKAVKEILALISDGLDHIFSAQEALDLGWLDQVCTPKFDTVPSAA